MNADLAAALDALEKEFEYYTKLNEESGFWHAAVRNRKGAALVKVAKAADRFLDLNYGYDPIGCHDMHQALAALREQLANHEQDSPEGGPHE